MVTYTVHETPDPPADRIDRADALEFVKDGFSWVTALFPPIGFIAERLWLALALYVAVLAALGAAANAMGLPQVWTSLVVTALNVYLGFELSTIKRWMLDQSGWTTLGAVTGRDLEECERRFLENWLPSQPAVATAQTPPALPSGMWPFGAKG